MSEYEPVDLSNTTTNHIVIKCSDHRFRKAFDATIESKIGEDYDLIARPGPSKLIAASETAMIAEISKLQSLHEFNNLHIFDHTDCGGFGGLEAFEGSEELEAIEHFRMLKLSKEVLHHTFPNITVVEHVIGIQREILPFDQAANYTRRVN